LLAQGAGNTEWIEIGLKEALFADAAKLLESLLNDPEVSVDAGDKLPGEKRGGCHEKNVLSLFGKIRITRDYFYNPSNGGGRYPMDSALGLENGYTPGVVRLMCRAGARETYEDGSGDLKAYAGLEIGSREINRMVRRTGPSLRKELESEQAGEKTEEVPRMYVSCDGTGIPMRKAELESVEGKADKDAKTKEVKVGCVFTQHPREGEEPFRDCDSTSYIATLRRCHEFGPLLRKEAYRRGMGRSAEVVFIADGAAWIWEVARTCFPGAVQILDYYHAREYLSAIVEMLYGTYKREGYFYGSGVVEAGCKSVIGKRAKQSGVFWSTSGAEDVLAIRTALCSDRFDQYWDQRNAA